jgi:hypothetical protein
MTIRVRNIKHCPQQVRLQRGTAYVTQQMIDRGRIQAQLSELAGNGERCQILAEFLRHLGEARLIEAHPGDDLGMFQQLDFTWIDGAVGEQCKDEYTRQGFFTVYRIISHDVTPIPLRVNAGASLKLQKISSPRQVAVNCTADAFGSAINGKVKVGLGILDNQGRRALEAHFDAATLVLAAAAMYSGAPPRVMTISTPPATKRKP